MLSSCRVLRLLLIGTLALGACASHDHSSGESRGTSGPVEANAASLRKTSLTAIRVAQTSVFVDNPAKAHAFYTEVLGFRSKQFDPAAQIAIVVSPEKPGGVELLLEPRGLGFAKVYQDAVFQAGFPVLILAVPDVGAARARFASRGVKFRDDLTRKAWGLENMFEDGFGNILMLRAENE